MLESWEWEYPLITGDELPILWKHCAIGIDTTRILVFGESYSIGSHPDFYILDTIRWTWTRLSKSEQTVLKKWGYSRESFSCVDINSEIESENISTLFLFGGAGPLGKLHNDIQVLSLDI